MNITEKKNITSSELRTQLKVANKAYTECLSNEFLGRFLAGEKVNAEDFCINERQKMKDLDKQVYGEF